MRLLPVDSKNLPLVTDWLLEEENWKWLDFGSGVQRLAPAAVALMARRDTHVLKVFTAGNDQPAGLVALSNIALEFRTAMLWYLLGDKSHSGKGLTSHAVREILDLGFGELALASIWAWVAEPNRASLRVLEKNGFRKIGRQRHCHVVGGELCDRILFDIVCGEHRQAVGGPEGAATE